MSSSTLDVSTTSSSSTTNQRTNSTASTTATTTIPLNRIKTIMKSSPEISNINQDTLLCVCKATELFIQTLTKESFKKQQNKKSELDYENLANLVSRDDRFQFLSEIVPFKMKLKDALKLIEAEKRIQK